LEATTSDSIRERQMSIDADVLNSEPAHLLSTMYGSEYPPQSLLHEPSPVPSMLNALGACAGFAAQVAVWRELVLPAKRNPGEFFVYAITKSRETFFFGEAINLFLFSMMPDRVSFLSLAAAALASASELFDISELASHVSLTLGTEGFGRPRACPSVHVPELPRRALTRTWGKAAHILRDRRPAEWPALLGAAAYNIVRANRKWLPPPVALRVLLEAAVPMSKLNPATVEQSGVPSPILSEWSMRALRPESSREVLAEVRGTMPVMPSKSSTKDCVIDAPRIAFLNLAGESCEAMVAEDRAEIGDVFHGRVEVATTLVQSCDVLFVYCTLEPSGEVVGQQSTVRDLIAKTGASVAVIASEVRSEILWDRQFQKSLSRGNHPPVNLVITANRKGEAFGRFFRSLFELMRTGMSMPAAWATLAPQTRQQTQNMPGSICLMEADRVVFGKDELR
jgi:hypothetical protein